MDKCECKKILVREPDSWRYYYFSFLRLQRCSGTKPGFISSSSLSRHPKIRLKEEGKSPQKGEKEPDSSPPLFTKVNEVVAIFFPIGVLWRLDMRPKLS